MQGLRVSLELMELCFFEDLRIELICHSLVEKYLLVKFRLYVFTDFEA